MKELAIISGKGGTGKTSISAALIALQKDCVSVDCDVDAANLYLLLNPELKSQYDFYHGQKYIINSEKCTSCGKCVKLCKFNAISDDFVIDPIGCEGCSVCAFFCPEQAISGYDNNCGEVYLGEIQKGPVVYARLDPGEGNSGLLVAKLREEAKKMASSNNLDTIILDGPPGIGCPVISTITGVKLVLAVTEPNISALHDLKRVLELADHFRIKALVCINRADINPEITSEIKDFCRKKNITIAGEINSDNAFLHAQRQGKDIITYNGTMENPDTINEIKKLNEIILNEL
ncbi:MAG: ATP-binding protein [Spirochaetota bacterium]